MGWTKGGSNDGILFHLRHWRPDRVWDPPSLLSKGYKGLLVRMREAIPLLPQYVFMAWYLIMYRDKFIFLPFTMKQNLA
jgi:hypothetical protein